MFDHELGQSQSFMSTYVLGLSLPQVQHILKVAAESVGKFLSGLSGTLGRWPPTCSVTILHSERGGGTAQIRTACAQNRVGQLATAISQCISQGYRAPTVLKCFGFGCEFQRGSKTFRSQNYRWDTTHIFQ